MMEKRALQGAVAVAGLVPVAGGLIGMIEGAEAFGGAGGAVLDGHIRYLSGLLLALGLAFWSAVPAIERRTLMVRLLSAAVVLGGLARLYGAWRHGLPGATMQFALVMELVVTPLLCLWQARVAARTLHPVDRGEARGSAARWPLGEPLR
ncbi:MAG TPA: DUF4345 domain-containing protein [Caulobacteraceae bacterium]|jgi:hypothetical protein